MECNDLDYVTITNIQKLHSTILNSKVSKNIRNQGETLFCWAFAISTMLRQSLNLLISKLNEIPFNTIDTFKKLNSVEFHRQLRNELIMIPIPKNISNEFNENSPLSQGHYIGLALERVRILENRNKILNIGVKSYIEIQLTLPTAFDETGIRMLDSIREIFDILGIDFEAVRFSWIKYNNEKDLIDAIKNQKCPVVDVLKEYYSSDTDGSHAMVATGIKEENGIKYIQLKNSFADNPNEQGNVHF